MSTETGDRLVSTAMTGDRSSIRYAVHYGVRLASAHLLAVAAAAAMVIPLSGAALSTARPFFTENLIAAVVLVLLGAVAAVAGGVLNIVPALRWFLPGQQPNMRQRAAAMGLASRQSALLAAIWVLSGGIVIALNTRAGLAIAVPTTLAVLFGATAAVSTALLLVQRPLRPILLAARHGVDDGVGAPGVLARLVIMWILSSGLPCGAIAALIFIRSNGWIIPKTTTMEGPVLMVSVAAVLLGLPAMILTSRSIADPIQEVIQAMAEVERGRMAAGVGVLERSEIGQLQMGFNRMVAGLAERDLVRDLFGRHVGTEVARRAIEEGASLSGDVREVAVLFIDLVGSTQLAARLPPQQVAELLNDFFRIVVDEVDEGHGLVNKFEGDAALAVFGAPLPTGQRAALALAVARALATRLRQLPLVDFGIGVSAGRVFAGNIGAENRYEYTVIGDAVNEAARLADLAKTSDARILCSAAAIDGVDTVECRHWADCGSTVLKGRSETTRLFTPVHGA